MQPQPSHKSNTETRWQESLDASIETALPRMVQAREHLHAHPEPSGEEFETTQYINKLLPDEHFVKHTGPEDRGLIVEPTDAAPDPKIILRADIDALRLNDAKTVSYRSTREGIMHACGHDGHTAIILGAVWALDQAQHEGTLPCEVPWRAVFQPAEETNKGAIEMINHGLLENAACIIGNHLDPSRATGDVGVRFGVFTADCVEVRMRIIGKGGHAARPHESLDPVACVAQLISSIYQFVPRTSDSNDPIVISFGTIHGGSSANIIPDEVQLSGTLRTFRKATRIKTMDHIRKLSRALAEASDTRIEIDFLEGPPALENNDHLTRLIKEQAEDLLGPEHVQRIKNASMGGEDFANYVEHLPGAMFRLGCAESGREAAPLHSPQFDLDPAALGIGAKILARTAVAWALQQQRRN